MERLAQISIKDLKTGDMFYIAGDSKKTVYQKIQHAPKATPFYTYTNFAIKPNSYPAPKNYIFKKDTRVIFLRNINDVVISSNQNFTNDNL